MIISNIIYAIKLIRFIPAFLMLNTSRNKHIILYEVERWLAFNHINTSVNKGFFVLMQMFPEFRSLVYHRIGSNWLRHFGKGQINLYFHTPSHKIGKGLMIWHGYSTVINAETIGENCSIWHNVTLGKKTILQIDDKPRIGNNVSISTGSIIVGDIEIADGVTIGAGTVVVSSVKKENVTVVGIKGRVIS